jgi:hypothetical protein
VSTGQLRVGLDASIDVSLARCGLTFSIARLEPEAVLKTRDGADFGPIAVHQSCLAHPTSRPPSQAEFDDSRSSILPFSNFPALTNRLGEVQSTQSGPHGFATHTTGSSPAKDPVSGPAGCCPALREHPAVPVHR